MDIPFQAIVYSQDGVCGCVTAIIVQPRSRLVTHLVVCQTTRPRKVERLVAMRLVSHSQAGGIYLDYPQRIFDYLPKFTIMVEQALSLLDYTLLGSGFIYPESPLEIEKKAVPRCNVPPNCVALYADTPIRATNGRFGTLASLITEPDSHHITHLVVQRKQLWKQHRITLPIKHIGDISEHQIRLQLDKQAAVTLNDNHTQLRITT